MQEIEAIATGTLKAQLVAPKDVVVVGQPIAAIEVQNDGWQPAGISARAA